MQCNSFCFGDLSPTWKEAAEADIAEDSVTTTYQPQLQLVSEVFAEKHLSVIQHAYDYHHQNHNYNYSEVFADNISSMHDSTTPTTSQSSEIGHLHAKMRSFRHVSSFRVLRHV